MMGLQSEQFNVVPIPKKTLLHTYEVRIRPSKAQSHGIQSLSVVELEVEEINKDRGRRASLVGSNIFDVAKGGLELINNLEDQNSKSHSKSKSMLYSRETKSQGEHFEDLSETEIEAMNFKAERERKLKEHK